MVRKRQNEQSLGEAISYLKQALGWSDRLRNAEIIELWPSLVGEYIAKYTTELFVKNKVLFVRISSSALRNEMNMGRAKLVNHINQELGEDYLKEIRLLG